MVNHDQEAVIAFLTNPSTYGLTSPVERIDTHISHLFLIGTRAFKLKRAVSLPYLDFSTPDRRFATCKQELTLNRRTSPELYLGVRRITGGATGCELQRFDQKDIFDQMALQGKLTLRLLDTLAHEISTFHAVAPMVGTAAGAENIAAVLNINEAGFRQSTVFTEDEVSRLGSAFAARLHTHAALPRRSPSAQYLPLSRTRSPFRLPRIQRRACNRRFAL